MLYLATPDDFRGDPYGWLTNQMSHVLAGLGGAWLAMRLATFLGVTGHALERIIGGSVDALALVGLFAAALASGSLEVVQLRRGGTLMDSLTDFAFVLSGAAWTVSGGNLLVWLLVAAGLFAGTVRRSREHKD